MRGRILAALPLCLAASALILTSCETTQDRISKHPDMFNAFLRVIRRWYPRDKFDPACPKRGLAGVGFARTKNYWKNGAAVRRKPGFIFITRQTLTIRTTDHGVLGLRQPSPAYSFAYMAVGAATGTAPPRGRNFVFFGDPFYDPFYYSYIPPSIPYRAKWSLSPMVGLSLSSIWRRTRAD